MSTARLFFVPVMRALDDDGNPLSGALLYFYATGTTTPVSTYASSALTTTNANPVVADSDGWFTPIYLKDDVTYRAVLKDSGGSTIWDVDPYAMPVVLTLEQVRDEVANFLQDSAAGDLTWTNDDAGDTFTPLLDLSGAKPLEHWIIPITDTATAPTAGVKKYSFQSPFSITLPQNPRATLDTAQTSGSIFTVDINEGGTSILSTKLTIDNGETSSTTAATAAVLSDTAIAEGGVISIDVDQVGDGTARGLNVIIYYRRT